MRTLITFTSPSSIVPPVSSIPAIKALRDTLRIGLLDAKNAVDEGHVTVDQDDEAEVVAALRPHVRNIQITPNVGSYSPRSRKTPAALLPTPDPFREQLARERMKQAFQNVFPGKAAAPYVAPMSPARSIPATPETLSDTWVMITWAFRPPNVIQIIKEFRRIWSEHGHELGLRHAKEAVDNQQLQCPAEFRREIVTMLGLHMDPACIRVNGNPDTMSAQELKAAMREKVDELRVLGLELIDAVRAGR